MAPPQFQPPPSPTGFLPSNFNISTSPSQNKTSADTSSTSSQTLFNSSTSATGSTSTPLLNSSMSARGSTSSPNLYTISTSATHNTSSYAVFSSVLPLFNSSTFVTQNKSSACAGSTAAPTSFNISTSVTPNKTSADACPTSAQMFFNSSSPANLKKMRDYDAEISASLNHFSFSNPQIPSLARHLKSGISNPNYDRRSNGTSLGNQSSKSVFTESALIGVALQDNGADKSDNPQEVYLSVHEPFCLVALGIQGSGKSHTMSVILESCLLSMRN
ncbi:hypothetical protein HDU98_007985 [Podochytrium sp. JEL0797]|nr:hypothetical protein HDU98_007985 [Podochytrium sp. JEL0797]